MKYYEVVHIRTNDKNLYICPHCKWVFWGEKTIRWHINKKCLAKPDVASCATCMMKWQDEDGKWHCDQNQVRDEKPLFEDGNATAGCVRYSYDGQERGYFFKQLEKGEEFTPRNYNQTFRVVGIIEEDDE